MVASAEVTRDPFIRVGNLPAVILRVMPTSARSAPRTVDEAWVRSERWADVLTTVPAAPVLQQRPSITEYARALGGCSRCLFNLRP